MLLTYEYDVAGTDSRLGVGFRVGPNADFQIQVELGPQTRTKSLGPDAESDTGSSKKRHIPKHDLDLIQEIKMKKVPDTPQGWLNSWKASVGVVSQEIDEERPGKQVVMDYDTVQHLQQLYREQPSQDDVER